jgi:hypothetical protein
MLQNEAQILHAGHCHECFALAWEVLPELFEFVGRLALHESPEEFEWTRFTLIVRHF